MTEHWDYTPKQAVALQRSLASRVQRVDRLGEVHRVAGVDVGFPERGKLTRAAVAVLAFPSLELVDHSVVSVPTRFPYVPGLLSFREIPAILEALSGLASQPDLMLVDGQGIAHPRRLGIASHLGLELDCPTIGVAKSRLVGQFVEPSNHKGDWTPLCDGEEVIGAVLRTRAAVRPVFVSIGHRVCLETAIRYTLQCTTRYRLPETTRYADRLASHGVVPTAR
ncbi:MAG: deoxyribonuclease V [Pseudomonadota bacterium]|nr:deoxyribonuclease V [Pseudomonadota bacterium]